MKSNSVGLGFSSIFLITCCGDVNYPVLLFLFQACFSMISVSLGGKHFLFLNLEQYIAEM